MTGVNGGKVMRDWLIGQGEDVHARGAIPAHLAEKYYMAFPGKRPGVALLPGPDDDLDAYDDMGEMIPDAGGGAESEPERPARPTRYVATPDGPEAREGAPGPVPDAPPGHARKDWGKSDARPTPGTTRKSARVTAGIRTDISSKVSLVLEIVFRTWQARDPVCGGTAVEQRPDIADAFTEIVCGSPDLVAWFTGSGGQFMLWLNLCAACAPVATIVVQHHVYHSLEEVAEDPQQPQYASYAA